MTVPVTTCVLEIAAGCVTVQVGGSTAAAGLLVRAQASVTVPVKPPLGVTVIVEVAFAPADVMLIGVALSEKAEVTVVPPTVSATFVVSVRVPEVPDTFTV